ncbi:unnamed protein product, partial [Heterosigma akashiwo]
LQRAEGRGGLQAAVPRGPAAAVRRPDQLQVPAGRGEVRGRVRGRARGRLPELPDQRGPRHLQAEPLRLHLR